MTAVASKAQKSTYVTPEEKLFYNLHQAVINIGNTTSAIEESFELQESPSTLIFEQQFDVITEMESLAFQALTAIHEVARGRLTDWKEEEHLEEKFLFEMGKRKSRVCES